MSGILATNITRIAPSTERVCRRCGRSLGEARADTVHCFDCNDVLRSERAAERLGVDLMALADDEWFNSRGRVVQVA